MFPLSVRFPPLAANVSVPLPTLAFPILKFPALTTLTAFAPVFVRFSVPPKLLLALVSVITPAPALNVPRVPTVNMPPCVIPPTAVTFNPLALILLKLIGVFVVKVTLFNEPPPVFATVTVPNKLDVLLPSVTLFAPAVVTFAVIAPAPACVRFPV
jgi:hypothetical protein